MEQEKTLGQNLDDLRMDLKEIIETRYEILRAEVSSGIQKARSAAMLVGAAAAFAVVGLILLGACVALAIGLAFGAFTNQVGLVWGFLVTGAGSLMFAGMLGAAGKARLKTVKLVPERTLRVLKHDEQVLKQGGNYGDRERGGERKRA